MKVWVYTSRRGEISLFAENRRHWARIEQDADNGCDVDSIIESGEFEVNGDPDKGDFSIDDGGSIELTLVQE
jgi:hypothetical protein